MEKCQNSFQNESAVPEKEDHVEEDEKFAGEGGPKMDDPNKGDAQQQDADSISHMRRTVHRYIVAKTAAFFCAKICLVSICNHVSRTTEFYELHQKCISLYIFDCM